MLWERRLDTMALIAWGSNRIVVVFRGTNSLKNVMADLEVRKLQVNIKLVHGYGGRVGPFQGGMQHESAPCSISAVLGRCVTAYCNNV